MFRHDATSNAKQQDRQCTNKSKMDARSRNHCYPSKIISITYSECMCL